MLLRGLKGFRKYPVTTANYLASSLLFSTSKDISKNMDIQLFTSVDSTMDRAKDYLKDRSKQINDGFVIIAESQSAGRGTKGRSWSSNTGNLFMTVGIRIKLIQTPLQLTPLRVGTILVPVIKSHIADSSEVKLKWPNDVLVNKRKISGVLIEVDRDFILIGIGVNISSRPDIIGTGADSGRPATCLYEHIVSEGERDHAQTTKMIKTIGEEVATQIYDWAASSSLDAGDRIVSDFNEKMDYSEQRLRLDHGEIGDTVVPEHLNADGTLQVKASTGESRTLVADYLF